MVDFRKDNPIFPESCAGFAENFYFRARFPRAGDYRYSMKKLIGILTLALSLLLACSKAAPHDAAMPSPDPHGGEYAAAEDQVYTAIVTVKQSATGRIFFQLDDDYRLFPENYTEPFTRQCRIICGISVREGTNVCSLDWMDYLQEGTVQNTPAEIGDGVDILDDWMTSVEDGYLTLHYSTYWGQVSPHTLLLVSGENPDDPYEVRLVHLRNGDEARTQADALIYFDLASLPPTGGNGHTFTLNWKDGAGHQLSKQFLYRSRQ